MKIILCIIPFHILVTSCYSKDKAVNYEAIKVLYAFSGDNRYHRSDK